MSGTTRTRLLKSGLWFLLLPGTVAGALPLFLAREASEVPGWPVALRVAGAALGGLGLVALLWCFREFATRGGGTPAPVDPPARLVARGLYRHVRNPMYLAVALVVLGEALLFAAPILLAYALLLAVGFAVWVRRFEEPSLARRFGPEYEAYRAAVPRWIPRPGARRPSGTAARDGGSRP